MKRYLLLLAYNLALVACGLAQEATLSFASKAQRTVFTPSQQVWTQQGITLTNNQANSVSDMGDYAKPARFYKSSEIIVECHWGHITKIVFDCNTRGHAENLHQSLAGVNSSVSYDRVTVRLEGNADSFTIASLSGGLVYLDSLTVTYLAPDEQRVAPPTIAFDGAPTFDEAIHVRILTEEGATAYYTLNGETPTAESTAYAAPLTIRADATLKAVAYTAEGCSSVAEQTFVKNPQKDTEAAHTATLVTNAADLAIADRVIIVASDYDAALATKQNANYRSQTAVSKSGNKVALNEAVQILSLVAGTANNSYAFKAGNGYLCAASSSDNLLKTQSMNNLNSSWGISIDQQGRATIKAKGEYEHNWLRYNATYALFSCYFGGQEDVSLYKVERSYQLHVSPSGWTTLCLDFHAVIPAGVTCYAVSKVGTDAVVLKQIRGILPANSAVIIRAAEGAYTFDAARQAGAEVENLLVGTMKDKYVNEEGYVLTLMAGEAVLQKAEMTGGVFLNTAHHAYLPTAVLPTTAWGTAHLALKFEPTGIEHLECKEGEGGTFDLMGRPIREPKVPGIYIIQGKKVGVK